MANLFLKIIKQNNTKLIEYDEILNVKSKKINKTKYDTLIENKEKKNKLEQNHEEIMIRINTIKENSKHIQNYEYDPKCKFCVKNIMIYFYTFVHPQIFPNQAEFKWNVS